MDNENESIGVRRAARRRVNYELGIDLNELKLDSFYYLTRIHYAADNVPFDGIFGEHEIDYCLILKGDFKLNPRENEVKSTRYCSAEELKQFMREEETKKSSVLFTPWFKMICEKFLFDWWANLDSIEKFKDHQNIHRFF